MEVKINMEKLVDMIWDTSQNLPEKEFKEGVISVLTAILMSQKIKK